MRQRTAEVLEIVIKEHLVDNRFSIERDKVLEALGQNESKEAQEFLSHILNITDFSIPIKDTFVKFSSETLLTKSLTRRARTL